MIPLVVASERGRAQTIVVAMPRWGWRTAPLYCGREEKTVETVSIEGDRPVSEAEADIAVS